MSKNTEKMEQEELDEAKLKQALKVSQMLVAAQEEQIHEQHLRLNAYKTANQELSTQLEEATHTIKQSSSDLSYRYTNLKEAQEAITWKLTQTEEAIRIRGTTQ